LTKPTLLSWGFIRVVAELQILTKATYFMLVFVPILAGTWPAVRHYVNNHNDAVIEATKVLEIHSKQLEKSVLNLSELDSVDDKDKSEMLTTVISELIKSTEKFSDNVKDYTSDFLPKVLEEPSLPWTWAATFFASLLAVLAHLLYQMSCPDIIRRFTFDEYIKDRKEDYSKHPSESTLELAKDVLSSKEGKDKEMKNGLAIFSKLVDNIKDNNNKDKPLNQIDIVTSLSIPELLSVQSYIQKDSLSYTDSPETLELVKNAIEINSKQVGADIDFIKHQNMAVIDNAAKAEYLTEGDKNRIPAYITIILYVIAIWIIGEIILIQSSSVFNMAGWTHILDLFTLTGKL
jgi:hypothetical protein